MGFIIKVTHRSPAASPREIYYGAVPIDRIPIDNAEEQQIIAEKQSALVEKYGATKYGPLDVQ